MNESPILDSEFVASVIAVPPLARRADYTLDAAENRALIRHIEAGGVSLEITLGLRNNF